MDVKKIFDDVFGDVYGEQKRGIPVRLSAFEVNGIHRKMVEAFNSVVEIEKEMNVLSWKLNRVRREFSYALEELEIRIYAQEEESQIGGTKFRIYKPGDEDDRTTEV